MTAATDIIPCPQNRGVSGYVELGNPGGSCPLGSGVKIATCYLPYAVAGMSGRLKVVQDSGGQRSLALPSNSKVSGNGAGRLNLTNSAGAVDWLHVFYDGTTYWWRADLNFT